MKTISRKVALWSHICLFSASLFTACKHEPPIPPTVSSTGGDDDNGGDDGDDGGGMAPDTTLSE